MCKALVIGCGNIGALYDFDNDKVLTHVKALANHPEFEVTVFDTDPELAKKISGKYGVARLDTVDTQTISYFDCVSICTPTFTHFSYLSMAFEANTKVIICEKPISNNRDEITSLKSKYLAANSSVIVNYMRRFSPAFIELRDYISEWKGREQTTNIIINYQRGFINNCSHAFDLLQFLFNKPIEFTEFNKNYTVNDHFETDPTITAFAKWDGSSVNIIGLHDVQFSHFEIDIYFITCKVKITESGDKIFIYKSVNDGKFLKPLKLQDELSRVGCINNYMIPVAELAYKSFSGPGREDNFLEAADLNLRMLNYLK